MKRVVIAAIIVSFVTVGAFPASKSKAKSTAVPKAAVRVDATPVPLAAIFPKPAEESMAANGMVSMDAPNHEVIMVRINDDGTKSHACVNDEAAARAFLDPAKSAQAQTKRGE